MKKHPPYRRGVRRVRSYFNPELFTLRPQRLSGAIFENVHHGVQRLDILEEFFQQDSLSAVLHDGEGKKHCDVAQ